jgi:hypothetical protein
MFIIDDKYNMHLNRGDRAIIRLTNTDSTFKVNDTIVFSIMKKGNAGDIVFQKHFTVEEDAQTFDLVLLPNETRLGNVIKSGSVTYWYEIEYNGVNTLVGYFTDGPKEFILYPEAAYQEGSI